MSKDQLNVNDTEQLLQLMGEAAWRFREAAKQLRLIATAKKTAEYTSSLWVNGGKWELFPEGWLKDHFKECCEDPKYKFTLSAIENFVYLLNKDLFDEYIEWETQAKQAKEEFDMYSKILSWHQSKLKHEGIEAMITNNLTS